MVRNLESREVRIGERGRRRTLSRICSTYMSLLKLLTVGRSFVGALHEPGRYKMSPEWRLPQFGSNGPDNQRCRPAPREQANKKTHGKNAAAIIEGLVRRLRSRKTAQASGLVSTSTSQSLVSAKPDF